jgi:uncharacterized protein YndB with AHSA1/START domain
MVTVERHVDAPPAAVWSVLADGWSYAWVVGTALIRSVDAGWPSPGTHIHHSVGFWPFLLSDDTEALESVPERRLVLQPRARPLGRARVVIELEPEGSGTRVRLSEEVTEGPGRRFVPASVRGLITFLRNREGVRRVALRAEGRTRGERTDDQGTPPSA